MFHFIIRFVVLLLVQITLLLLLFLITTSSLSSIQIVIGYDTTVYTNSMNTRRNIVIRRIKEVTWRQDATNHQQTIYNLIKDVITNQIL